MASVTSRRCTPIIRSSSDLEVGDVMGGIVIRSPPTPMYGHSLWGRRPSMPVSSSELPIAKVALPQTPA